MREEKPYFKSSCPGVFSKNDIFKHFSKLKGKRLRRSLFLNKVAGLTLQLYKKRNPKVFFCEFCKIVGNFFLQNTFGGCFCYCLHRQTIWGPTNVFVTKNILWNHRKNRTLYSNSEDTVKKQAFTQVWTSFTDKTKSSFFPRKRICFCQLFSKWKFVSRSTISNRCLPL